uniref:Uncharacterized protein n=1 Tax=Parascaris univalens TaxID=6257 RepID=A0A915AJC6_PARUN
MTSLKQDESFDRVQRYNPCTIIFNGSIVRVARLLRAGAAKTTTGRRNMLKCLMEAFLA